MDDTTQAKTAGIKINKDNRCILTLSIKGLQARSASDPRPRPGRAAPCVEQPIPGEELRAVKRYFGQPDSKLPWSVSQRTGTAADTPVGQLGPVVAKLP